MRNKNKHQHKQTLQRCTSHTWLSERVAQDLRRAPEGLLQHPQAGHDQLFRLLEGSGGVGACEVGEMDDG